MLQFARNYVPTELFPRSLLIVILPMVLIQLVVAYIFLERHWNVVTQRLSHNVVASVAMLIDLRQAREGENAERLSLLASDAYEMSLAFLPGDQLPPAADKPFLDLLDSSLSQELERQIGRPFWLSTSLYESHVDIRIALPGEVMRVLLQRDQVYATNAHIFLIWMFGGSVLLLTVAIIFLRNQIRPIEKLAAAAQRFGLGQDDPQFRIAGASEIRKAGQALLQMRERLRSHMEQRTIILAGVSHDLRTPLTRLKLRLAMLGNDPQVQRLKTDTQEMESMLENYLNFAKGYQGEASHLVDVNALLEEISADMRQHKPHINIRFKARQIRAIPLKRQAFKRCLTNLVENASKHAHTIAIASHCRAKRMTITIEDDGPGIAKDKREDVFRPFFRLNNGARTEGATSDSMGLGLAIARDVARGHGGDIYLDKSSLGGVRARVQLPLAT